MAEVTAADMSVRFLLLDRIRYLEKAGHEVTAIFSPGPYTDDLRRNGLRIEPVPMRREISPLQDVSTLIRLISIFRRDRFDVVFSHTPKPGLLVPLAARIARIPLIIHTVHGLLIHDKMPRRRAAAAHLVERFTALCCHHLFFVSAEDVRVAKRLVLKRASRLHYIGNGIDTARFHPPGSEERENARAALGIPDGAYVVGTVGRMVWEKGYKELLEAADRLGTLHPDMLFIIVGPLEPDQSDALQQGDIARIHRHAHVRWLGETDDVRPVYAAMDLFVLPSHREGTPLTVMEAAASGVPVVATDIRGCREVVEHGMTGLLYPLGDVKLLVAAIEQLWHARDIASAMGAAGRRLILSRFDQETIFDRLACRLERLTRETRRLHRAQQTRRIPSLRLDRSVHETPSQTGGRVINALTIDLEDWRQLVRWKMTGEVSGPEQAVTREVDTLLCLLSQHGTRATFFVLANVAKTYPHLVRRIAEEGHEIASHGWSHRRVYTQSPQLFRAETLQSKELLEQIVQQPVVGYRAAEFSITSASWWALELLAELRFEYDSSIYPVAARRYGIPRFDPNPSTLSLGNGRSLREIPPLTLEWAGRRWPVGGGTTFALVPSRVIDGTIRSQNSRHRPAVLYFHPYEFSSERLKPHMGQAAPSSLSIGLRHSVPHNFARQRIPHRVHKLLTEFHFAPIKEMLR
jgi:polysaccharide deacetylase family protein (PEP-CTERM system associated)